MKTIIYSVLIIIFTLLVADILSTSFYNDVPFSEVLFQTDDRLSFYAQCAVNGYLPSAECAKFLYE